MSRPVWRLLLDGPAGAARNMAVDRAMLACRVEGLAPATLRLYSWAVPSVSLGRFQALDEVDLEACGRMGFEVVRRPTGGKGVLHDDEVTYACVAGLADGVPRGTSASYRHLCAGLAAAYRRLGVAAELTSRPRGTRAAGACYLHATRADLSLGAAKLSGSAQVWKVDAVLQHGSFVLTRDAGAESEVFRLDAEGREALKASAVTLAGALGSRPDPRTVVDAAVHGFEEALGIALEPGGLTPREEELATGFEDEAAVAAAANGAAERHPDS